jgi:glycosyltransferase involved in cell wall biosynthesis
LDRKKILFIPRWYPDRHDNMLGLFVQKHAMAVQSMHDVSVLYVTTDTTMNPGAVVITENVFQGIQELHIYFGKHDSGFKNAITYWNCYKKGIGMIVEREKKIDLTHVHILTRAAIPALWLKFTKKIPYIITEHWSRYLPVNLRKGSFPGWWRRTITRFVVKNAAAITTVTQNLATAMQGLDLKGLYYITPNIADINDFKPAIINSRNPKKLVHVSCFDEPAKNIKGIIDVIAELTKERIDFNLEIIGDGKDYQEVHDYAIQTKLVGSRIFFTGLLTGKELSAHMAEADALVMFSNYENFPCTIVESMACGVPVISTAVGGIPEHLQKDFGILIQAKDNNGLKAAIESVLDQPQQFNKDAMRKYAITNFSMESSASTFDSIYRNAIQHAG